MKAIFGQKALKQVGENCNGSQAGQFSSQVYLAMVGDVFDYNNSEVESRMGGGCYRHLEDKSQG